MAKVLLVDDNGSVLLTLAIALRRHGHTVSIASDGWLALDALRTESFDALVSDVRMPGLTGPELAAEARQLQPKLHIVLTSAYPSVETATEITAFLRKPIDIEQLHALLIRNGGPGATPPAGNTPHVDNDRRPGQLADRRRMPRRPHHPLRTAHA